MARDIRDFLMMLRHGRERMSPGMLRNMLLELTSRIRHGDLIIHHPKEIEELVDILTLLGREIPLRDLQRVYREFLISLEESPQLTPLFKEEMHRLLMRRMDMFLGPSLFEEEDMRKGKKEKKEEEEREKVFQSIGNISLAKSDRVLFL